ncbi:hypothetical protein [Streptomyces sp. 8K308]|uniref:hypothetical protein n=1 Tax=Streptomyces sp. 8K308 TaxID=2530388 RepID=UPI001FB7BE75|nr:hypothetical protein [Streptomyces sp. 8K308]
MLEGGLGVGAEARRGDPQGELDGLRDALGTQRGLGTPAVRLVAVEVVGRCCGGDPGGDDRVERFDGALVDVPGESGAVEQPGDGMPHAGAAGDRGVDVEHEVLGLGARPVDDLESFAAPRAGRLVELGGVGGAETAVGDVDAAVRDGVTQGALVAVEEAQVTPEFLGSAGPR